MIFHTPDLTLPLRLKADLCVIGSGAGGLMAAMVAAEAGLDVVVLEAGELLTPADMSQREAAMFPRLYWEGGGRMNAARSVRVHQGRGVGGSTLHNLNLCKRIPDSIIGRWHRDGNIDRLPRQRWHALYDEIESLLSVSSVHPGRRNRHNQLLERGCEALGWAGGGLRHNRSGCVGSGFCEIGCGYDAKNNAAKVLLPRAVRAGAEILACCQALTIEHEGGAVRSVRAVALDPITNQPLGEVVVEAPRICVSASATATPALLLRSDIPDPAEATGNSLRMHPAIVVAGDFEEPVNAWQGIPQTYECTEWLQLDEEEGERTWIVPAFAHPVGTATLLPGHGAAHRQVMTRYPHMAVLTAMIHDHTKGRVRPRGDLGLSIEYWPEADDQRALRRGLWASAKLLQAAGARAVYLLRDPLRSYGPNAPLEELLTQPIGPGDMDITAVHPMASIPMDDDPRRAAVDSAGKHHHMRGLWVADGSLFPTSIGIPPQESIYAMGLHVGRAIVASPTP